MCLQLYTLTHKNIVNYIDNFIGNTMFLDNFCHRFDDRICLFDLLSNCCENNRAKKANPIFKESK